MKTRREASLLIVFLALLRSALSLVVYKGRLNGEPCNLFSDCGHSAQSFLSCEKKICQCTNFQYYQEQDRMCVSYVGEICEMEEPTDGLPMVTCGENSECRPIRHARHARLGRCNCVAGYVKNYARKCVPERAVPSSSQQHHHHPNSILPDHPSHQHHGGSSSSSSSGSSSSGHQDAASVKRGEEGDKNNDDKQVISFPFYSANTNSKMNSASSNVKSASTNNSVLLLLLVSLSTLLVSFKLFLPNG